MICFDYRGYADSTDLAPNETGVVNDAKVMLVVLRIRILLIN